MIQITNREHAECVSGGFEPNFRKAGCGAIITREVVPAPTGELQGKSQTNWKERHVSGEPCLGLRPVPHLWRRRLASTRGQMESSTT